MAAPINMVLHHPRACQTWHEVLINLLLMREKGSEHAINAPSWMEVIVGRFQCGVGDLVTSFAVMRALWEVAKPRLNVIGQQAPHGVSIRLKGTLQSRRSPFQYKNLYRYHALSIARTEVV